MSINACATPKARPSDLPWTNTGTIGQNEALAMAKPKPIATKPMGHASGLILSKPSPNTVTTIAQSCTDPGSATHRATADHRLLLPPPPSAGATASSCAPARRHHPCQPRSGLPSSTSTRCPKKGPRKTEPSGRRHA